MRLRLVVAYVGTRYAGWQVQPHEPTVQGILEGAVEEIGGERLRVTGASRTDAGVHAEGQVCHFDETAGLDGEEWHGALNALLPPDVRVISCDPTGDDFHARYGAAAKTYRYRIDTRPVASPFTAPYSWHRPGLDPEPVRRAAALLPGPLDQRVFASRPEGDRHQRPIDSCTVEKDELLTITVRGRSFMRHAVRGMVGTLTEAGSGLRSLDEVEAMARGREGHRPLSTKAPAHGLCLVRVDYGEDA